MRGCQVVRQVQEPREGGGMRAFWTWAGDCIFCKDVSAVLRQHYITMFTASGGYVLQISMQQCLWIFRSSCCRLQGTTIFLHPIWEWNPSPLRASLPNISIQALDAFEIRNQPIRANSRSGRKMHLPNSQTICKQVQKLTTSSPLVHYSSHIKLSR